jgi:ABC-2 type transport system permease protein
MQSFKSFFLVLAVTARHDLRIWSRQWSNILAALVMPFTYVLVVYLAAAAVGKSPVALVVEDTGPVASQVAQAIQSADVFQVHRVDAATAQQLYTNLKAAAILTIPTGFSQQVQEGLPAPILVVANNLNADLGNDIRRAVPDAITVYYEQLGPSSPLRVTVAEQDLRSQDVSVFQFAVVPMISLLLLVNALISAGVAASREWEERSIKELLLAPVPRTALILGKVLAGVVSTFSLGMVMFGLGYILGWTQPQGIYTLCMILAIFLISVFASGLGIAMGTMLHRVQSVTSLSTTLSVWFFFLAGGIGVLQFEPDWLKQIAAFDPLTYGVHAMQMSVFYSSTEFFDRDVVVLGGTALLMIVLGWAFMRRGFAQ